MILYNISLEKHLNENKFIIKNNFMKIGTLHLGDITKDECAVTIELDYKTYINFTKEDIDLQNQDRLNRFLNSITYDLTIFRYFLYQCPFNTFRTYDEAVKMFKEYLRKELDITRLVRYSTYLDFLNS